ncbi:MerR family transcriptional regulator [Streptomyces yaizuensis]|uniref:MerR family transcriptional regulator n=1 Tax=Streptomyces yaizuensis TaxID=2989713 RepID=A0ABQ5NZW5_9ACTN|nr:MerR family transcriptional regulator [Streptomyces sp. YSPA8]GLF95814.1 MerR family transcriptional regulator [Streptomyces sp. YSPA8]
MTRRTRLTIGAFSRLSRLSAKALRRYDELGLLPPASVDPFTGYRYYDESQVERARLVVWLRRIGMPLAGVRGVCDLYGTDPAAAARAVRAYWAGVESETAARRDLALFLADQLARPDEETPPMTNPTTLIIRHAARTDRGLVRETDQDTALAGGRLLAVADGFGTDGGPAGAAAIAALRELDTGPAARPASGTPDGLRAGDLLNALEDAVHRANTAIGDLTDSPASGTTLTAMVWTGSRLALVHIGDSRAYLLRDGGLFRITHDHTVVQSMIDAGTLTEAEAATHPQRTLLLRALHGATDHPTQPDLRLHEARAGDRYLLCSDGLFTTVPDAAIRSTLTGATDPDAAVDALIALAHEAGAPDNIACVVADVSAAPDAPAPKALHAAL